LILYKKSIYTFFSTIGVAARKEIIIRIAWIPPKSLNWDFLGSKVLNKCLMTASKAFKAKASYEIHEMISTTSLGSNVIV